MRNFTHAEWSRLFDCDPEMATFVLSMAIHAILHAEVSRGRFGGVLVDRLCARLQMPIEILELIVNDAEPASDKAKLEIKGDRITRVAPTTDEVSEVFSYWKKRTLQPKAVVNDKRLGLIRARLREGFKVADLKRAIDGLAGSEFHNGSNQNGTKYLDLSYAIRDASVVERWLSDTGGGYESPDEAARREMQQLRGK